MIFERERDLLLYVNHVLAPKREQMKSNRSNFGIVTRSRLVENKSNEEKNHQNLKVIANQMHSLERP